MKDFSVWPPPGGEKEGDPRTFFFPGWGCSTAAEYAAFLALVAKWMRQAVYAVQYTAYPQPWWIESVLATIKFPARFHNTQVAKTAICLRTVQAWRAKGKITLIGYSEGAMHAILVAEALLRDPALRGLLLEVILINPAGITGVESRTRILFRAAVNGFQKIGPLISGRGREGLLAHMRSVAAYKKNFPGAGGAEGMTPGLVDLGSRLIYLREQGVDIRIIATKDDAMVPAERLMTRYWKELIPVHVIPGTHFTILNNPKGIADAIKGVINT